MKKGTNVSRSTYQKVVEENKRLLRDIKILVLCDSADEVFFDVVNKWETKFKKDAEFNSLMHESAKEYLKKHPEYDITKWKNKYSPF